MYYAARSIAALDVRKHIRKGIHCLVRHSRHGIKGLPFFGMEGHDGSSAVMVEYGLAAGGNLGLVHIDVQHVQAAGMEYFLYYFQLGIHHLPLRAAEQLGKRRLGDIVFGRTESSGNNHDVIALHLRAQGFNNLFVIVGNAQHTGDLYSQFTQTPGNHRGVCVHNLADENFIADSTD